MYNAQCTSAFDSWTDQVRWFVDQVAARFIQLLLNFSTSRWLLKHLAALRLGRPKTELSERVLPGFPVFLLILENVRLFGSGGLLFQSLRTVGDDQFRDIRNIKLPQAEPKRCCLRI